MSEISARIRELPATAEALTAACELVDLLPDVPDPYVEMLEDGDVCLGWFPVKAIISKTGTCHIPGGGKISLSVASNHIYHALRMAKRRA